MRPTNSTIRILGPLEVNVAGMPVALPAKQRTLLAILTLHANRSVTLDRLVEAIWGEDASPGVARTLQSHIFQLRRALARAGNAQNDTLHIATDGSAYRLEVDASTIDAEAFLELLQEARGDGVDPRRAAELLARALAHWRGSRVADVGDEPAALAEALQLEDLRVSAILDLAWIRIEMGQHEQIIPELRRALAETPYNEQLWASLMLALALSDRRAESLIAYRNAQAALRRELDIEPGRVLQDLALGIRDESIGPLAPRDRAHVAALAGRSLPAHHASSLFT